MLNDLRYAFRTLRQNPGFALVAIISLALGIGANATIFSVAEALLLRPLPVPQPSRVVWLRSQPRGERLGRMSYREYLDVRGKARSFENLAAFQVSPLGFSLDRRALPVAKPGLLATADFFRVMKIQPALGRVFRPDEDQTPGRDAVAVISHELWKSEFGASPDAIGQSILLNGIAFTVIGVTPESFTGIDQFFRPAIYVPMMMAPRLAGDFESALLTERNNRSLMVKGRLKPGVTAEQASAEAALLAAQLEKAYPDTNRNRSAVVQTEFQQRVDQSTGDAILVATLLALVAVVLLIACANVANLMLSRASGRAREVAIRLAVGAGRMRLIRQLLTESLVVAALGGAAGLALAQAGVDAFSGIKLPSEIPIILDIRMDARVVLFTALASLASAILFGLAPALQAARTNLVTSLKSGEAKFEPRRRLSGRNALVVSQVAGSLLLLVCAAQLFRATYYQLSRPAGFRTDHVLMVTFDPSLVRYTPAQTGQFYRRLLDQARSAPGVKSAALTRLLPISNWMMSESVIPEGYHFPPDRQTLQTPINPVTDGYFETAGIPILRGRGFEPNDTAASARVAVVNERFAQRCYGAADPVGKRFWIGDRSTQPVQIIGVARQSKYQILLEPPREMIYLPLAQYPQTRMTLLVQSSGDSRAALGPIRDVVRGLDPNQPLYSVRTMEEYFDERARKILGLLTGTTAALGLLGLVLSMVGLYGLMSYSVSRRTREIGIRMAIGADRTSVVTMVLRRGLLLTSVGVAIGALPSLFLSRTLTAGIGAQPFDLAIFILIPLALLATAALSAYLPARYAARIDPTRALRLE